MTQGQCGKCCTSGDTGIPVVPAVGCGFCKTDDTGFPVSTAAVWFVCKSTIIGVPMTVETEPSGIPSGPASCEEDEWTESMVKPAPEGGVRVRCVCT